MGRKYQDLKRENEELRQALAGFVQRVGISKGDLVVFRVSKAFIGPLFGYGWGGMNAIGNMLRGMVGGEVRVMATTDENPFALDNLDRIGRMKLREQLDRLDKLADPKAPPREPVRILDRAQADELVQRTLAGPKALSAEDREFAAHFDKSDRPPDPPRPPPGRPVG